MPIITLAPAVRTNTHVLISIGGTSWSGKSYSALLLARGLAGPSGRIAMLDTETGRGRLCAHVGAPWDHADLTPPYSPERYVEALKEVEAAGYDVCVIDSGSHEWAGEGGVLEIADAQRDKNGNELAGLNKWARPIIRHKKFIRALMSTRMHVIVCLRAQNKTIQTGGRGHAKALKELDAAGVLYSDEVRAGATELFSIGERVEQRQDFLFEMTIQLMLEHGEGRQGFYKVEKYPDGMQHIFTPGGRVTEDMGRQIGAWVNEGVATDTGRDALKIEARSVAESGVAAFRDWWLGLGDPQREVLRTELDNLKSIADEADRIAAGGLAPGATLTPTEGAA